MVKLQRHRRAAAKKVRTRNDVKRAKKLAWRMGKKIDRSSGQYLKFDGLDDIKPLWQERMSHKTNYERLGLIADPNKTLPADSGYRVQRATELGLVEKLQHNKEAPKRQKSSIDMLRADDILEELGELPEADETATATADTSNDADVEQAGSQSESDEMSADDDDEISDSDEEDDVSDIDSEAHNGDRPTKHVKPKLLPSELRSQRNLIIGKLDDLANVPAAPKVETNALNRRDLTVMQLLYKKYKLDYTKMFRDHTINILQYTPKQLEARMDIFTKFYKPDGSRRAPRWANDRSFKP